MEHWNMATYPSIATFFMIVSFPDEAAEATCCSMLLLIFALSSWLPKDEEVKES